MAFGIKGWGAYVPRLRLERAAIAAAHAWMAPSLGSMAKGRRAFCAWDEDVVTMAVEAARTCLAGRDRGAIGDLVLASTTAPSADLQSSAIVGVALRLSKTLRARDVGGSQRAGLSALADGLGGVPGERLVVASERPRARPASAQEMQYGAAAAAFLLGEGEVAAERIGGAALSGLFVDHFRAAGAHYDYVWEERWVRDEGYLKLGVQAVVAALADADVAAADVACLIFPAPSRGAADAVAKAVGIAPTAVAAGLEADIGFSGAAHGLLQLAQALDEAAPGDVIVVVGFAQGCEALVLRATDQVAAARPKLTLAETAAAGFTSKSYLQMATAYGEISPDWGMRAERDTKTALTEQYRSSDQVHGFLAGRCPACAQVQFPQLAYCVTCQAPSEPFEEVCLADEPARVITFTADSLMYHPSPPLYVGFAQFENGARLLMEFVDVDAASFDVGAPLEMRFRIKESDAARGYYRYFWKAAQSQSGRTI